MKNKLIQFMSGRYGMDQLSKFMMFVALAFMILSIFVRAGFHDILVMLALATIIYVYFRAFSKQITRRYEENQKFLTFRNRFVVRYNLRKDMWNQRKEYKFFKCPSCKAVLRVPRGKGRIKVVCKKCGTAFERKS